MEHLEYLFGYLKGTRDYGLRAPLNRPDVDLFAAAAKKPSTHPDLNCGWEFYCDSDFAGNPTESNNRRSHNGFVALLNGAPVLWGSKVPSVAFAHPKIGKLTHICQVAQLKYMLPVLEMQVLTSYTCHISRLRWQLISLNLYLCK